MIKWYEEDWHFLIEVLQVKDNNYRECRLGYEKGDVFHCEFDCPAGFCSKTMLKVFPFCEAVRSGGNLLNLGGSGTDEADFICPDGVVEFRIKAVRNK